MITNALDANRIYTVNPHIYRIGKGYRKGNDIVYTGEEGLLHVNLRFQVSIYCLFNLTRYPWDEQKCSIDIEIINADMSHIQYCSASGTEDYPNQNLGHYILRDFQSHFSNLSNKFNITIDLSQKPENYIWTIYLPTTLMVLIG
ncbi:hypothetical protein SK128_013760 [Halocaridina rubra]|uniref:Neurotransmitter-gated ion-channel ligand-binding domain-containing protein n=1 Tax=Halocaridina rubra TaxID=373956 RepID=A0AAN8X540_HALRR